MSNRRRRHPQRPRRRAQPKRRLFFNAHGITLGEHEPKVAVIGLSGMRYEEVSVLTNLARHGGCQGLLKLPGYTAKEHPFRIVGMWDLTEFLMHATRPTRQRIYRRLPPATQREVEMIMFGLRSMPNTRQLLRRARAFVKR